MPSSSGSTQLHNSVAAQRKEKRMLSNRESARRSRMRKQKHLDDLTAQLSYLRQENNQILSALNITTRLRLGVEAENSVLRTRALELGSRLQSLQDLLIHCINAAGGSSSSSSFATGLSLGDEDSSSLLRPWAALLINQGGVFASDTLKMRSCH